MLADPSKRIRAWDSLPVGVVTLAERHGGVEVTPEIFEAMVDLGVPNIALAEYKSPDNYPADDCPMCKAGEAITVF